MIWEHGSWQGQGLWQQQKAKRSHPQQDCEAGVMS